MTHADPSSLVLGQTLVRQPFGLVLVMGALLSGCASTTPAVVRVEPVYRLQHATAAAAASTTVVAPEIAAAAAAPVIPEGAEPAPTTLPAFRAAVIASPQSAAAHHALGVALARQGLLKEALASLDRAVGLAPDDARMHNNLGYTLASVGQIERARAAFQRAVELDAHYTAARTNLAWLDRQQSVRASATVASTVSVESVATVAAAPVVAAPVVVAPAGRQGMSLREVPDLPRSLARDLATAAAFREAAQHVASVEQGLRRQLGLSGESVDARNVHHERKGLASMPAGATKARKFATVAAVAYKPTYLERKFWSLHAQPG